MYSVRDAMKNDHRETARFFIPEETSKNYAGSKGMSIKKRKLTPAGKFPVHFFIVREKPCPILDPKAGMTGTNPKRGKAMARQKPYADYKFIGVKPFTTMLDEAGVEYVLFDDTVIGRLFSEKPEYFNRSEDTICIGKSSHEQAGIYFAEFGLRITQSYRSHIVFIFDHHPSEEDMFATAGDIEQLVAQSLEGVNISDIIRH